MFVSGLVVGLVVGLVAGAFLGILVSIGRLKVLTYSLSHLKKVQGTINEASDAAHQQLARKLQLLQEQVAPSAQADEGDQPTT